MTRRRANGEGIGGRPRKHSPRAKRVAVYLEPRELAAVKRAAAKTGLTIPDFCTLAVLLEIRDVAAGAALLQKTLDDQS